MPEETTPVGSDALVRLLHPMKENYQGPPPRRPRGNPRDFSAWSFLFLAVVAVVLRPSQDSEVHNLLSRAGRLREALEFIRVPHRPTIGRRLQAQVPEAEAQIAALGQQLLTEVERGAEESEISAVDGRRDEAAGPLWHKSSREEGSVPVGFRNGDTASAWSQSGYRGWVQGYRLVRQGLGGPAPVPLFAVWRPTNENEAVLATTALAANQLAVTDVLVGASPFGAPDFTDQYAQAGGGGLTPPQVPLQGHAWKAARSASRKETSDLLFQRILQASGLKACQVKGRGRTGAFVLASGWLYQLIFLDNYRHGRPMADIKDLIDDARWRSAA
jgi:hypothetical protein